MIEGLCARTEVVFEDLHWISVSDRELLYRSFQPTVTKKVISDVQGYNSFKSSAYQTCLCMQIQNVIAFENFSLWQEACGYA